MLLFLHERANGSEKMFRVQGLNFEYFELQVNKYFPGLIKPHQVITFLTWQPDKSFQTWMLIVDD